MKPRAMRSADVAALIEVYREAARAHMSMRTSDSKTANRQHDRLAAVYRELRRRGVEAQRALLILLDDPDEGVRCWVGAHALEFAPDEGEPVLLELARSGQGFISFDAEMTLKEWKAGRLRFP